MIRKIKTDHELSQSLERINAIPVQVGKLLNESKILVKLVINYMEKTHEKDNPDTDPDPGSNNVPDQR